ncbi:nicotinate phosphoribosyltransferase [Lactarius vividus]|nr:nicotinate phosphoribosyltransferase [Lactarius vividus]
MASQPDPGVIILPRSILDTDLYKLTMQQAVLHHFPSVQATYRFTHRDANVYFTRPCYEQTLRVPEFTTLSLTSDERAWLQNTCPDFKPAYIDYLSSYRFQPSQVQVTFVPPSGLWAETILWEVPLMATLSEIYFTTVDKDWSNDGQAELAYEKGSRLLEAGCAFSEFGTRRRRSYYVQDIVVDQLIRVEKDHPGTGKLIGTSNVHLAQKYGINPIGTIAHEWFMGVSVVYSARHAEVYPDSVLVALTDTFSTKAFFQDFSTERVHRWRVLRQDSGDPFSFAPQAKEFYERLGINHRERTIIYSDSLDLDKTLALKKQCEEIGFIPTFGIGTFFTNDFKSVSSQGKEKSRALNMVIKLASANGLPCIKISDDLMKNTGDRETVSRIKDLFELPK